MGRLERRQAGAGSASVLGIVLLVSAALVAALDRSGMTALAVGVTGGLVLLAGVMANVSVSRDMIQDGRR